MADTITESTVDDNGLPMDMFAESTPPPPPAEPAKEPEVEPDAEPVASDEPEAEAKDEPEVKGWDKGLQNVQIRQANFEKEMRGGLDEIKDLFKGMSSKGVTETKEAVAEAEQSLTELFSKDDLDEMPTTKSMIKLIEAGQKGRLTTAQAEKLVDKIVGERVGKLEEQLNQQQTASKAQRDNDQAMEQLRTENPDVDIDAATKEYHAKTKYMIDPKSLKGEERSDLEQQQSEIWNSAMDSHRKAGETEAEPTPTPTKPTKSAKGADISKHGTKAVKAATKKDDGVERDENGLPTDMLG